LGDKEKKKLTVARTFVWTCSEAYYCWKWLVIALIGEEFAPGHSFCFCKCIICAWSLPIFFFFYL